MSAARPDRLWQWRIRRDLCPFGESDGLLLRIGGAIVSWSCSWSLVASSGVTMDAQPAKILSPVVLHINSWILPCGTLTSSMKLRASSGDVPSSVVRFSTSFSL